MSPSLFPPTGVISIGDDGQDLVDLDVEFVGLMPVTPSNPPEGLAAPAAVAPAAVATAAVAPAAVAPTAATPVAVAVGANHGDGGRDQATQRHKAIIAAGNIGDPQVFPSNIHGRSP